MGSVNHSLGFVSQLASAAAKFNSLNFFPLLGIPHGLAFGLPELSVALAVPPPIMTINS